MCVDTICNFNLIFLTLLPLGVLMYLDQVQHAKRDQRVPTDVPIP